MEWYFILLIVLLSWSFLTTTVYAFKRDGVKDYFKYFHVIIFITVVIAILSPIIIFGSLMMFFLLFVDNDKDRGVKRIFTFTIPKIEEEHRIVLKQLGFEEGTFESYYLNRFFKGFKKNRFEITYDGKGMYFGKIDDEDRLLIKQLKNLKSKAQTKEIIKKRIQWDERTIERAKKSIEEEKKNLEAL
jgi:hypothetical protein